jgi:hypothetical protein
VSAQCTPQLIALDVSRVPDLDYSALQALKGGRPQT